MIEDNLFSGDEIDEDAFDYDNFNEDIDDIDDFDYDNLLDIEGLNDYNNFADLD